MIIKALQLLLLVLLASAMALLLGAAREQNASTLCTRFDISTNSRSGNQFVRPETIRQILYQRLDTLEGKPVSRGLLKTIKKTLESVPYVERAHVYRTIDGSLRASITQRDPMMRIINNRNESFYVDTGGRLFPLSDEHTARVIIATGHIPLDYAAGACLIDRGSQVHPGEARAMAALYEVSAFIAGDPFWKAFIDQIVVLPNGKFELIPKNGIHTIEFGDAQQMEEKFAKLRLFYRHGLSKVGWQHYKRVNVEFNQQIVCSIH